jgi:serine/threonine-protein kinase RsbW
MNTETQVFEASVDSLEPMRDFVSEKVTSLGVSTKQNYGLCLAIDEIATNIIRYGYPLASITDGKVEVEIVYDAGKLTVTLMDSGVPFDPFAHRLPTEEEMNKPLEERPIGGLGIMMAKQSVDEFKYDFVDGKNINSFSINI